MADLNVTTQEGGPRVLDFVFGAAIGIALSVGVMEVVKGAEFGQADLYGPGATVKISDTVTPLMGSPNLNASGFDETGHLAEFGQVDLYGPGNKVKITDAVTVLLVTSIDVTQTESLKIADTASAQGPLLSASGFDEVLYLEDGVLYEELLHLQDSVTAFITAGPQVQEQTVHVQDTATVSMDSLQIGVPDGLKIADTVSPQMLLVQASVAELLHLADPVTVSRPQPRILPLLYSSVTLYPVRWSWE